LVDSSTYLQYMSLFDQIMLQWPGYADKCRRSFVRRYIGTFLFILTNEYSSLQIFENESHASVHSDKTKEGLSLFGKLRELSGILFLLPLMECAIINQESLTTRHLHLAVLFCVPGFYDHLFQFQSSPLATMQLPVSFGQRISWPLRLCTVISKVSRMSLEFW
jgi:hypothetical protein